MHRHYLSTVGKLSNKLSVEGIYKISRFIAELTKYSDSGFDDMQGYFMLVNTQSTHFLGPCSSQIFESFDLKLVKMDIKFNSLYFQ